MKHQSKLIVGFVLVFIVVVFSVINTEKVAVNFGFAIVQSPLIFIILGSTILGALIVFVTWFSSFWRQRKEVKQLKKQVSDYQENIDGAVAEELQTERLAFEAELAQVQSQVADLESQLRDLHGEVFVEAPLINDPSQLDS